LTPERAVRKMHIAVVPQSRMPTSSSGAPHRPRAYIGTSGWVYPSWRGSFYPMGLHQRDELAYASRLFSSIEINGTFYSLQRPERFQEWRERPPAGFPLSIKGSHFITHMKKLRDVDVPLANFFASGLLALGDKLGPILWQFPASMPLDLERFEAFFDR